MDKEREQKFFMLRMFRFIYQICGAKLPDSLHLEIDKFPDEEASYFTESITRAALILMNERYDTREVLAPIDSDHFGTIARAIALNYDPLDFLKFCSWYIMRAATDPNRDTSESYKRVWSAIENVFGKVQKGGFNSDNWDKLDEVATKVVEEDYIKCRRLPNFDPKKKLDLDEEKAFVLRLMQHVFSLSFKELPEYYKDKINKLDDEKYILSENVKNAIHCLLEIQHVTIKILGEKSVQEYYKGYNFNKFKPKEFLEYCACFTRKAYDDFYRNNISFTPYKVHDSCVKILQLVREKGMPIPWDDIEYAAIAIIEDNECRLKNEHARMACQDSKTKTASSELKEYVPLMRAITESQELKQNSEGVEDDIFDVQCCCCMCS